MNSIARRLIACAFAACIAAPAGATVGPDIKVRLTNIAGPAKAGTPLSLEVQISSARAQTLRNFSFRGERWTAITHDAPADSLLLAPGQPHTLHWQGIPVDPDSPVDLGFTAGGRRVVKHFDLSRRHWDMMRRPNALIATPEEPGAPGPAPTMTRPAPASLAERPATMKPVRSIAAGSSGGGANETQSHNVRIRGRFWYKRGDGQTLGADGVTIRAYDEDWDWDEHLGTSSTDANGYFDFTVTASEDAPDIYCEFETSNGAVTVEDGSLTEDNYLFTSHVKEDFTGSDVNYGSFTCADNSLWPALHILTNITRSWRWIYNQANDDIPNVEVQWPDGDWPNYDGSEIHMPNSVSGVPYKWKADTHIHEYGHHVMENKMTTVSPEYDNGVCNNPNGDPGHCIMCEESDHDAVNEGWPNWFSDYITRTFATNYGLASDYVRSQESVGPCLDSGSNPCACDPYKTEGFLGALVRDIEDGTNESDSTAGPWQDRITLGPAAIFDIQFYYSCRTPQQFITRIIEWNPGINREDLWETFMNAGYQNIDTAAPNALTTFKSSDHYPGTVASPDNSITFTWDRGTDDWSGPAGYSIAVAATAQVPDQTLEITNPNQRTWIVEDLAPGTYWASIRAQDRSGKWGPQSTAGPFVIRDPYPADLRAYTPFGWDDAIVPRATADSEPYDCKVPATLPGNIAGTYWNMSVENAGELATPPEPDISWAKILLDGQQIGIAGVASNLVPHGTNKVQNRGPVTVRGGRHTIEAFYDANEEIAEHYETNNHHGGQYVWTPLSIAQNVSLRRAAPPQKDGGWNSFPWPIGTPRWFNCDGLSYSHQTQIPGQYREFTAVYAVALDAADDVDLYLHPHSTGSTDGFTNGLDGSTRAGGLLDAVFTNRRNASAVRWDVGVVNDNHGAGDYLVRQVSSAGALALGDSVALALGDSVMMAVREFYVASSQTGKVLVRVAVDSTQGPVTVLWFDRSFSYGGIGDFDAAATTGSNGRVNLTLTVSASGYHGLAIYRNPAAGFAPVTVALEVLAKPADPKPASPAGWHAALTPRSAADGTPASVPAPAALIGETANTWFNVAVQNASDIAASSIYTDVRLDGQSIGGTLFFGVGGGATEVKNNLLPKPLPGGRHVLGLALDPSNVAEELSETNNGYAEQWVWTPPTLALNSPVWRKAAGHKTAGWSGLAPGDPLIFNCDGIRTPAFESSLGNWAGFAVVPGAGSDVDLRLHERSTGAHDGFDLPLESSGWEAGAIDFVLVNFHATAFRGFDVGLLRATADTASYLTQNVASTFHPTAPGAHGPYAMAANDALDLHEFKLSPGTYTLRLLNQAGSTVDWGLALYGEERPYQNRTAGLDVASEWLAGPGVNEELTVQITQAGNYCLAVWKNGAAEAGKTGSYVVEVSGGALDAPQSTFAETRLASAYPNPFRPSTRIAYTLAHEEDVVLEVYDVRGARVRTLQRGRFGAGRHDVTWDGSDGGGTPLPAGLYLVRMQAGAFTGTTKVAKVE